MQRSVLAGPGWPQYHVYEQQRQRANGLSEWNPKWLFMRPYVSSLSGRSIRHEVQKLTNACNGAWGYEFKGRAWYEKVLPFETVRVLQPTRTRTRRAALAVVSWVPIWTEGIPSALVCLALSWVLWKLLSSPCPDCVKESDSSHRFLRCA